MRTKSDDLKSEEEFLARWSQRKLQAGSEEAASQLEQPVPLSQEAAEALPTDADMPLLDSLTPESDYTGFLSPRVSAELRRAALRKLFQYAEFNLRDGLDDYDDDFTSFAKLGNIVTAEMRRRQEMEEERCKSSSAEDDAEEPAGKTVSEQAGDQLEEGDAAAHDQSEQEQVDRVADRSKQDAARKEGLER